MKKIIISTMVKDEDDIIEIWINYHGNMFGFDNLYIYDNYSSDNTFKICEKYRDKGVKLFRARKYKWKGYYMTKVMKENNCDIFFPLDVDEFITLYDKNKKLINCKDIVNYVNNLSNLFPDKTFLKCNYLIPLVTINNEDSINKFTNAFLNERHGDLRKTIILKNESIDKNFVLDHGNHLPNVDFSICDICYIHFHFRSNEQTLKKVFNNIKGLGYKTDLESLKEYAKDQNSMGVHHINKLIKYLTNDGHSFEPKLPDGYDTISIIPFLNQVNEMYINKN